MCLLYTLFRNEDDITKKLSQFDKDYQNLQKDLLNIKLLVTEFLDSTAKTNLIVQDEFNREETGGTNEYRRRARNK